MTGMVFSFLDLNMTPYLFLTQGTLYYYLILAFIFCVFFDACRRKLFSGTKPVITCFVDAICVYPQYFRLSYWHENGLDVRGLIENVKKSSGLSDFGGDEMGMIKRYQPLLTTGVKQSGVTLSPFGVLTCAVTLEKLILIRLKMVDYINRHPSILNIKLKCPVFVVGFPRTGTTFLHELLGLHPSVRMHHLWEQMYPVPETHDESMEALTADRTQRHFKNWFEFKAMLSFGSDEIQSIHRVGYDEPEECTLPCAIEAPYNTMTIPFLCFVAKQVADLGAGETFHLYRKYLQLLAWQTESRQSDFTWMLKCPFHLPYLTDLHTAFPDATIVWTHRDPVECIASACSLYEYLLKVVSDTWTVDRVALGQAVLEYSADALERAIASIEKASNTMKIIHVRYADNVKDPKSICKQILENAKLPFPKEYEQRIDDYLARNAKNRNNLKKNKKSDELHSYCLEDYGLSKEVVLTRFNNYIERYNLRDPVPTLSDDVPITLPQVPLH